MSFILAALDKLTYFLSLIAFCVSLSYSWLKWELIHLIWSGFGNFWRYFQLIARGLWQLFSLGCISDMPQLWKLWKLTTLSMLKAEKTYLRWARKLNESVLIYAGATGEKRSPVRIRGCYNTVCWGYATFFCWHCAFMPVKTLTGPRMKWDHFSMAHFLQVKHYS